MSVRRYDIKSVVTINYDAHFRFLHTTLFVRLLRAAPAPAGCDYSMSGMMSVSIIKINFVWLEVQRSKATLLRNAYSIKDLMVFEILSDRKSQKTVSPNQ